DQCRAAPCYERPAQTSWPSGSIGFRGRGQSRRTSTGVEVAHSQLRFELHLQGNLCFLGIVLKPLKSRKGFVEGIVLVVGGLFAGPVTRVERDDSCTHEALLFSTGHGLKG